VQTRARSRNSLKRRVDSVTSHHGTSGPADQIGGVQLDLRGSDVESGILAGTDEWVAPFREDLSEGRSGARGADGPFDGPPGRSESSLGERVDLGLFGAH